MAQPLINPNPVVHQRRASTRQEPWSRSDGEGREGREAIDALEVYEYVRDIVDPEHPYTLEELRVVEEELVAVNDDTGSVRLQFTPTVEHCSMATLIGLCIRVRLMRSLPARFKLDIRLAPGSHTSEEAVNKQLNDKERVVAAMESPALLDMVNRCLADQGTTAGAGGAARSA